MGVGISSPALVRAVSSHVGRGDCMGVASGTAAVNVLACRLQLGDTTVGASFNALAARAPGLAADLDAIYAKGFIAGGKASSAPYLPVRVFDLHPSRSRLVMEIASSFTVVWESRQGHDGPVGINFLQKIELSQLPALYGAVLAGADYVCVGAGNPAAIPGYLRHLARHERVEQQLHVARASAPYLFVFDPRTLVGSEVPELPVPRFLAIVTTVDQALALARDPETTPFGFVFENSAAGGHNAPPIGYRRALGEPPKWESRDELEVERLGELHQPFWLAGGYGNPESLRRALDAGATGVQIGTTLALAAESGIAPSLRAELLERIWRRVLEVSTEPLVSPTGFPFKVAQLAGTLSSPEVRCERERHGRCNFGHLATPVETHHAVERPDGTMEEVVEVHMICPAEPLASFTRKGGVALRRKGSACLCNGLMSTAGLPAVRADGFVEPPIVTLGDGSLADVHEIQRRKRSLAYEAADALEYVLEGMAPR